MNTMGKVAVFCLNFMDSCQQVERSRFWPIFGNFAKEQANFRVMFCLLFDIIYCIIALETDWNRIINPLKVILLNVFEDLEILDFGRFLHSRISTALAFCKNGQFSWLLFCLYTFSTKSLVFKICERFQNMFVRKFWPQIQIEHRHFSVDANFHASRLYDVDFIATKSLKSLFSRSNP